MAEQKQLDPKKAEQLADIQRRMKNAKDFGALQTASEELDKFVAENLPAPTPPVAVPLTPTTARLSPHDADKRT